MSMCVHCFNCREVEQEREDAAFHRELKDEEYLDSLLDFAFIAEGAQQFTPPPEFGSETSHKQRQGDAFLYDNVAEHC